MSNLDVFTDEQLQRELEQREKAKREEKRPKPLPLKDMNPEHVCRACQDRVDSIEKDGWADSDNVHYIYEAAMTMVFGNGVWDWMRSR
jgi:hypothetical protein